MESHSKTFWVVRVTYSVGNGRRVRFWMDKWCKDEPLMIYFPFSFPLATPKEAWVEKVRFSSLDGGCWAPHFSKQLND